MFYGMVKYFLTLNSCKMILSMRDLGPDLMTSAVEHSEFCVCVTFNCTSEHLFLWINHKKAEHCRHNTVEWSGSKLVLTAGLEKIFHSLFIKVEPIKKVENTLSNVCISYLKHGHGNEPQITGALNYKWKKMRQNVYMIEKLMCWKFLLVAVSYRDSSATMFTFTDSDTSVYRL